ncbi:MAG: hypothetical protein RLZZ156_930 [Deinococcota bacterium]|jgi:hypothetical protein
MPLLEITKRFVFIARAFRLFLLAIICFFGVARAETLETTNLTILYASHLEAQAQELEQVWNSAQGLILEVSNQTLPSSLCLEVIPCAGLGLQLDPAEPALPTGLRGLVAWLLETAARPPPAWFLTALIQYQMGAVLPDAKAAARRRAWLSIGVFPSLTDLNLRVSADVFATRAEFGSAFAAFLLQRFGLAKLKLVLKFYYANWSLSDAFLEVLGVSLESLFANWHSFELEQAAVTATQLKNTALPMGEVIATNLGKTVWLSNKEFITIKGTSLYRGQLGNSQLTLLGKLAYTPNNLSLSGDALVYSRPRAFGAISGEVFRFVNGEEQLTLGANATDAVADGECVVYVQAASSIWRWCNGISRLLWKATKGWRVQDLAAQYGKIAMTVIRAGGYWDIAVLDNGIFGFITSDLSHDQTPHWLDTQTLVYSSDRLGTTQLWSVRLDEHTSQQITAVIGGAFDPSLLPNGTISFSSFAGLGSEIRLMQIQRGITVPLEMSEPPMPRPSTPIAPTLLPDFGIAFSSGLGLEALGSNGVLTYRIAVGYDFFGTNGIATDFSMRFAPVQGWQLTATGNVNQTRGYRLLVRATWYGTGEVFAEPINLIFSPFLTFENGVLIGWLDLGFGAGSSDAWGYVLQNWQVSSRINTNVQYSLGLNLADMVAGAILETNLVASGTYGSPPLLLAQLSLRTSWTTKWRIGDGVLSFERLTPQVFVLVSSKETSAGLQIALDGVLNYNTVFSLGFEISYSSRNAWIFGIIWR